MREGGVERGLGEECGQGVDPGVDWAWGDGGWQRRVGVDQAGWGEMRGVRGVRGERGQGVSEGGWASPAQGERPLGGAWSKALCLQRGRRAWSVAGALWERVQAAPRLTMLVPVSTGGPLVSRWAHVPVGPHLRAIGAGAAPIFPHQPIFAGLPACLSLMIACVACARRINRPVYETMRALYEAKSSAAGLPVQHPIKPPRAPGGAGGAALAHMSVCVWGGERECVRGKRY